MAGLVKRVLVNLTRAPTLIHRPPAANVATKSSYLTDHDMSQLQSVARESYFKLFQLEPVFDIDQAVLKKRFTELQRLVHPDKFAKEDQVSLSNCFVYALHAKS